MRGGRTRREEGDTSPERPPDAVDPAHTGPTWETTASRHPPNDDRGRSFDGGRVRPDRSANARGKSGEESGAALGVMGVSAKDGSCPPSLAPTVIQATHQPPGQAWSGPSGGCGMGRPRWSITAGTTGPTGIVRYEKLHFTLPTGAFRSGLSRCRRGPYWRESRSGVVPAGRGAQPGQAGSGLPAPFSVLAGVRSGASPSSAAPFRRSRYDTVTVAPPITRRPMM